MASLKCPNCKSGSIVYDSRHIDILNCQVRYRKCKKCGYRFKTLERVIGPVELRNGVGGNYE